MSSLNDQSQTGSNNQLVKIPYYPQPPTPDESKRTSPTLLKAKMKPLGLTDGAQSTADVPIKPMTTQKTQNELP